MKNKSGRKVSQASRGYQIPYSKKSELLDKMKLKPGDYVLSIDHKQIDSQSSFYRNLNLAFKKTKVFHVRFKRENEYMILIYESTPHKSSSRYNKYKLKILNKGSSRQIASSSAKTSSNKVSPKAASSSSKTKTSPSNKVSSKAASSSSKTKTSPSNKVSPKKSSLPQSSSKVKSPSKRKSLVPEKLKDHVQRAYVSRSNSFVYLEPNFDAPKIQSLSIGRHILISRKIFLPPHSFGSFYRVFLFREKKRIGYVSEAEVISEFIKKDGGYSPNSNYKKAKWYKAKKQVLKIEEIEDNTPQSKKLERQREARKRLSLKTNFKKYAGVSLGYSPYLNSPSQLYENTFLGLKLSAYSSKIHLDFNADLYRYKASSSLLAGIPFIKSNNYSLFLLGGGLISYNYSPSNNYLYPIDYGPLGAVSFLIPLNKKFLLKLEFKGIYEIRNQLASLKLLSGLQFTF